MEWAIAGVSIDNLSENENDPFTFELRRRLQKKPIKNACQNCVAKVYHGGAGGRDPISLQ